MNVTQVKAKIRALSAEGVQIAESKSLSYAAQVAKLDPIEAQLKDLQGQLALAMKSAIYSTLGDANADLTGFGFGGGPRVGNAPNLMPSEDQMRGLHEAVLSHKSFKIEVGTKAVSELIPATLMPGIVGVSHEPTRILSLLPSAGMTAPSVAYLRHTSTTGTAGTVAPGGLKPAVVLNTDKMEARARKIAVTTKVNDEDLDDFAAFLSYVSGELQRLIVDEENFQLLLGDGTGENIEGIFSVAGILTRAKAASPETGIDTLALAAADLRTGPALTAISVYAMHPTTWTGLTLLKDTQGRYILGNPADQTSPNLWGTEVVQSTRFALGTVLGMNAPAAGSAHIRQGLTIQTDFGTDGFEHNTTTFRAEERIGLAVVKPAAAISVTGL